MLGGSIPKLLQEAGRVKGALDKIGGTMPTGMSAADIQTKMTALEEAVSLLDALNAERRRLVNRKAESVKALNGVLVQARLAVKAIYGPDSSEYEMAGGTRTSERKKYTRKTVEET